MTDDSGAHPALVVTDRYAPVCGRCSVAAPERAVDRGVRRRDVHEAGRGGGGGREGG